MMVLELLLLFVCTTVIEIVEVGHNDWNWQGDRQDTGDGTLLSSKECHY
jgi:hypothetical protein